MRFILKIFMMLCLSMSAFVPMLTALASDSVTVDLDSLGNVNITEQAQYVIDRDNRFTFISPPKNKDWLSLNRQQLRFGFIDVPVWLKINVKTKGVSSKRVNLEFNKNIDKADISVLENNNNKAFIHKKAVNNRTYEDFVHHDDHSYLTLKPDSEYQLLIRLEGQNTINGVISLQDVREHQTNKQTELMLYLTYTIALFMVIIFNSIAYITTKSKAFWYHSIYGLSVLVFQLSQYGYLSSLMGVEDPRVRELLIVFSASIILLAILYFIDVVLECKKHAPRLSKVISFQIWVASITMVLSMFLPHIYGQLLIIGGISIGVIAITVYLVWSVFNRFNRFALYLSMISIFLLPPTLIFILSRLGWTDQTFLSEYLFLLLTPVEMIVISSILFFYIRRIEKQVSTAKYFDPETLLPNKYSLKDTIEYYSFYEKKQTLAYIWLSGLTKMQLILEANDYKIFISTLSYELNEKIRKLNYVQTKIKQTGREEKMDGFGLFNADRNTYALLINNIDDTHIDEILDIFNATIKQLQQDCHLHNLVKPIISVCNFQGKSLSADTIMQHCSLTLSRCVKTNKNHLVYDENLRSLEHRNALLTSGFSQAMKEGQFYLQWQPQFDSQTNAISGMEALIRWNHPFYGMVSPDEFIPLLEDTMQIKELTHWVIKSVFSEVTRIRKHFPGVSLSINLSVYDFLDDDLLDVVDHYLNIAPWISSNIILEVTETVMIEDEERILFVVKELQKRGFKVSIDDFGAGYASFGYLQSIPANELKIDRRYSMSCSEDNSQTIIKSIINIAQQLRMKVVVEGVEEQYQADLFKEWGAEYLQGWLFAKPMHLRDIIKNYT